MRPPPSSLPPEPGAARRSSRREFLRAAALASAGLALAGCPRRQTAVERGVREQTLHRSLGLDIPDIDPHLATQIREFQVITGLFEGLVSSGPSGKTIEPGVAERWDVSADGLGYTFHLRAGVRWSDGSALTAEEVLASLRRALSPSLGAELASLLYPIRGAEAYHKGTLTDFSQVGVSAPDARTLRLSLDHPTPYFLFILANPIAFPVPMATLAKHGPVERRGNAWTRPANVVGNGPFLLREWTAGQRLLLEKSPTYWDAEHVRLRAVHFQIIESLDAEERAFRAGQLHLTGGLPLAKIPAYREAHPGALRIDPGQAVYFYRVNTTRPFLNEAKVRRALSLAIDREAIAQRLLHGAVRPATTFIPPTLPGYFSTVALPGDAAAARALLAEAGFPQGRGLPAFELLYNTSENHRAIAEAVQERWRRELGVTVHLANQDLKSVVAARASGAYQILRSSLVSEVSDPVGFLGPWTSGNGNNATGWANGDYDRLLFEAARTADPAARAGLFQKAETLLLEEAPVLPLFHESHAFLIHPSVRGWEPTPLDVHPYKHVWLD